MKGFSKKQYTNSASTPQLERASEPVSSSPVYLELLYHWKYIFRKMFICVIQTFGGL